jgi:hypothetical protein
VGVLVAALVADAVVLVRWDATRPSRRCIHTQSRGEATLRKRCSAR